MGIFQRIKGWLSRWRKKDESTSTSLVSRFAAPMDGAPSEVSTLIEEHYQLANERARLKKEIEIVDSKYSRGELSAGDRDRAYRVRLARAGSISLRQKVISNRLVELGYPLRST